MGRIFNIAGPCNPDKHYMLSAMARLPEVTRLVEGESYFVVHAQRQCGKTTAFLALANEINAKSERVAVYCSLEAVQSFPRAEDGVPKICALYLSFNTQERMKRVVQETPWVKDDGLDYSVGVRNHGPEVDREYEIPEEVVSEAIINAIAHRDYLSTGSVQIELFADRLEIYNPGSINPALTPEKLKKRHGSFPNNPLIAEPLYLTKYIERLGSGLTDLIEHCRAVGLPDPEFHIDRFEFGIVIRRKGVGQENDPVNGGVKDVDAVNDAVNDVVNDAVNSLYGYIKGHPGLNGRKLAVALSRSEPTIDRQVKALKVKGLVEFRGAPKNGGYYVK